MILHVVLFRFTSDASAEQITAAGNALLAMQGQIPGVHAITWGPNLGPTAGEWPHVLTVTLDDLAAVERYAAHPVHRDTVGQFIHPIRDGRLAVDIELPGGGGA